MRVLLPAPLEFAVPPHPGVEFTRYDPTASFAPEVRDAEAIVAWGNSAANLAEAARELPRLRWVQSLSAGTDPIVAAGFAPSVTITSGRSLHDDTVAEHTLALLLALVRDLPGLAVAQAEARWSNELRRSQSTEGADGGPRRSLAGAHVVVWGYGSIARRLAPLLVALGADVVGIGRAATDAEVVPVEGEDRLDAHLATADALVMILPGHPSNHHALSTERLAVLRRGAWIVNVGRGSTLDEAALLAALDDGTVAGAGLDVFETEPLPAASPLWAHPHVIVTPHLAGGRPRGAADLIARNLDLFVAGRPLENEVARPV